jgi:hypothetical protein
VNLAAVPSSAPASSVSDSRPGQDRSSSLSNFGQPISLLSAEDLHKVLVGKISNLNKEAWIQEDISGQAILGSVDPSFLSDFLEQTALISSKFIRSRVEEIIFAMVQKDDSIDPALRVKWSNAKKQAIFTVVASGAASDAVMTPAKLSQQFFQTPGKQNEPVSSSSSAFFMDVSNISGVSNFNCSTPSFMKEVPSRASFQFSDSALFGGTASQARAILSTAGQDSTVGGVPQAGGNYFNITLNQPAAEPPKWIILESPTDSPAFYNWVKKNRREMLRVDTVDCKKLNQLVGEDVREEVSRIIYEHKQKMPSMFHSGFPYPELWKHVSDEYLLKILFGIHGPRSPEEAKERLQSKVFFFNDSTTYQDTFTPKLRKFCNNFKTMLQDFSFNVHQWPLGEELSRLMITDAFAKCFDSQETIKGPDGISFVPKCSNLSLIREQIRQKKSQKLDGQPLPLEYIINHIVDHFEKNDILIRSRKGLDYPIKPWNTTARKQKPMRQFNQITPAPGRNGIAKPPRPPANFPRCANCGSKGHLCGERTCYTFGHPKGKGPQGVWAEGTPSLKLTPDEWKEWNSTRHAIFYAYPENQAKKREPRTGNQA